MCISRSTHHGPNGVYKEFREELVNAGLLIPSGVRGLYGRSGAFEHIVEQFEAYITRMGAHLNPEVIHFSPIFNRAHYERTDHVETMPDLMGSVHSFTGGERQHRELVEKVQKKDSGWSHDLQPTEVMMVPAACYPLYPTATGVLAQGGRTVDLCAFVFRHEPSDDPARMQIFRQREYVRLGTADEAHGHRDYWLQRGHEMLESVGLDVKPVLANDPFFGRGGRVMQATQREQNLKYELVVPICSEENPTAVASCNYHLDHFGLKFDIKTANDEPAHSACIGFGLERIALALLKKHGLDPTAWPSSVKKVLAQA